MKRLHITALGSSFASGAGIKPVVNRAAMRSGVNYAHLLAQKLNADLTDLTASGATLQHVLDQKHSFLRSSAAPPQLDGVPAHTDIVTLTAGGNDLGYSLGMILDSAATGWLAGPLKALLRPADSAPLIGPAELTARLLAVVRRVRAVAPAARIYLVEYVNVFGAPTRALRDCPLPRDRVDHYVGQARVMAAAYATAAQQGGERVAVVPMSEISCGHEVGSSEPWVDGFGVGLMLRGAVPYHPNKAGHEAIAEALYSQVRRDLDSVG